MKRPWIINAKNCFKIVLVSYDFLENDYIVKRTGNTMI